MPDRYFVFHGLNPTSALQLVTDFVKQAETYRHMLREVGVKIQLSKVIDRVHPPEVKFFVKDRHQEKRNRQWRSFFEAFTKYYISLPADMRDNHNSPGTTSGNADDYQPLLEALPNILLASSTQNEHERAYSDEKQKLLVASDIQFDRQAELIQKLRFFTTAIRIASTQHLSATYFLCHLIDDVDRFSGFQSALLGHNFANCSILDCYYSGHGSSSDYIVFLPPNAYPERRALEHFCDILVTAPTLFDVEAAQSSGQILAALYTSSPQNTAVTQPQLLYAGHLAFRTEGDIAPRLDEMQTFEIVQLQDSESAMKRLEEEMRYLEPQCGYRLELRQSRYREANGIEYERLSVLQAEIAERIAELESFRVSRPMLLRFTQKQLPVLADVIRSYTVSKLPRLLYGFQGTTHRFSEGLHYLYVEPDISMTELDPLVYWGGYGKHPMRFWLDPHWARFYHRYENKALVFTPYGCTLYPSMHSWEVNTMDAYLRDILGPRYHGEMGVKSLPDTPIYLIDGQVGGDASLYLTVLDKDKFQPLHVRLGWLNDNLSLLDDIGVEAFIEQMADDSKRRRIAEDMAVKAQETEMRFEELAKKTSQSVSDITNELTAVITQELNDVIEKSQNFTKDAHDLNKRLGKIQTLYDQMTDLAKKTNEIEHKIKEAIEGLKQHSGNLAVQVESELAKAEKTRNKQQDNINREVEKLKATHRTLEEKVLELQRYT